MTQSKDPFGVDSVAEEAIELVTEYSNALATHRQYPKNFTAEQMINARLDEAGMTGWLTNLVARALLHKALWSNEISRDDFEDNSVEFISTLSVDGLMGDDLFPDLSPTLRRIFERSAAVYRHLGDLDSTLGLNNAAA
jgi:hypothetical protein